MLHRLPPDVEADEAARTRGAVPTRTVARSCSLCEASCGLLFEVAGTPGRETITSVRPDPDDVWSRGYVCPKGMAIAAVHHDADRLRSPVRRTAGGTFEPISWAEAFDLVEKRLGEVRRAHGNDAVATYFGNPITHNHGALLMRAGLLGALKTRNSYSAGSQDTSPRFAASHLLYGNSLVVPVPDIDRTDWFLCVGANPYVSQGSAMAGPDVKARIRAIRERGGKVVVVDPRRSETARDADEHVRILPGGDAAFLLAMLRVMVDKGLVRRPALALASGWDRVEERLRRLDVDAAATACGVDAATIRRLAREFAAAAKPVAYTRIGVCNNRFGTLATWAGDLLDLAAGRLGATGGAMFPTPAIDAAMLISAGGMDGFARWKSRVRGLPETLGDLPAACLAEEIETPGPGQVRALVTYAGNPALSLPNGRRVAAALARLDFMVSVDLYVNETTRHADVILPPAWSLAEDHVDVLVSAMATRNVARWSPPVVSPGEGELADWQILHELALRLGGGPFGVAPLDAAYRVGRHLGWSWDPTASLDLLLRAGTRGDRFLPWSAGLSMRKLKEARHGIDFGPLEEGVLHRLFHRDRKVHVGAEPFLVEFDRLLADLGRPAREGRLLLVGRRDLRSNNSWMHNVPAMVAGKPRCVLHVNPSDAARAGVADGAEALLKSRVHEGRVRVQVTDDVMPGVVSLPHGWGHAEVAPWQKVAGAHAGVSANDWTDDAETEGIVGQSVLNGVDVELAALPE